MLSQNLSKLFYCLSLLLFLTAFGCARSPIKDMSQTMRKAVPPKVEDDLQLKDLSKALQIHIAYWEKRPVDTLINFGPKEVAASDYLSALRSLDKVLTSNPETVVTFIEEHFDYYEVYGGDRWGEVFVTGYFEPVLEGSLKPTAKSSQALYGAPKDLVNIEMSKFAETFSHLRPFQDWVSEQKSSPGLMRGRLVPSSEEQALASVRPYYTREEIDSELSLKGRGLELAYVDPIDAFFLHIQGSGQVQLPSGKRIRLGYQAQNGHSYVPIGRFLTEFIALEEMSLQRIEAHMRNELDSESRQLLMNQNPSYVFFRKIESEPITYMGTPVVSGRTIATDFRYFPKGTLAFLEFQKPGKENLSELQTKGRFVIDQDTGGAIRGTHRVDLFCGSGEEAKQMAGVMRHPGRLWYLVPKEKAARLSSVKSGP